MAETVKQNSCGCGCSPVAGGSLRAVTNRLLVENAAERVMWNGREHLVAPVVLLVEGVHNGSQGPIYYPPAVLEESAFLWNGVPLPVYHPEVEDPVTHTQMAVSCNSPEVLESRSVGRLFNVHYEASPTPRLKGHLYVDVEKAKQISPPVLEAMNGNSQLEVSTGLFSIDDNKAGTWNGEDYVTAVERIFPDHLALLPGATGACSWADGCGVRANQKGDDMAEEATKEVKEVLAQKPSVFNRMMGWLSRITGNEVSYGERTTAVRRALDAMDSRAAIHYMRALFDDRVIYAVEPGSEGQPGPTRLYQRPYTFDEQTKSATLGDDLVEVREDLSYVPVATGNQKTPVKGKEEEKMAANSPERTAKVNALIGNGKFQETDREFLEGCPCETFARVEHLAAPPQPVPAAAPTANVEAATGKGEEGSQKPEPVTFASLLNSAPQEVQARFAYLESQAKAFREGLISRVKGNTSSQFSDEQLAAMDDDTLKTLADSLAPTANYAGQGGGPSFAPTGNEAEVEEPLMLPSYQTNEEGK